MLWQRLDRDNTIKVINAVKNEENASMFNVSTSEVKQARLFFYDSYNLYKITNFASLPSFTFEFLSDGKFFQYMDGVEASIYAVNDKGGLKLDEHNVINYISFFFDQVGSEEGGGDVIVISDPNDMPLLDSLDADAYNSVLSNYMPAIVTKDSKSGNLIVETDLYLESHLVRATIEVTPKGRVKIVDQQTTMHQVMKASGAETAI